MSVFNRDLVVQILNKLLGKADLVIGKTDEVLGDTKKILTAVNGGTGVVKSVQRGLCNLYNATQLEENGGTVYEQTIKINAINPEKALVLVVGSVSRLEAGDAVLRKLRTNELVIGSMRHRGYQSDPNGISWQVIEFY